MSSVTVRYLETSGGNSQEAIQALLDEAAVNDFELFQIVPNIDDRRGNPGVTAGMFFFFKAMLLATHGRQINGASSAAPA
jgi:hypothetical protein